MGRGAHTLRLDLSHQHFQASYGGDQEAIWRLLLYAQSASEASRFLCMDINRKASGGPWSETTPASNRISAAEFVLQDLKRFPGKGWDLIKIGLCGRVIRMRNMAINALRDLGKEAWLSEAMEELRLATEREPDDEVRQRMRDLVRGQLRD